MNDARSALVVDDERDIRELLVLTLGRMGLRVDTAASLSDARALLGRGRYERGGAAVMSARTQPARAAHADSPTPGPAGSRGRPRRRAPRAPRRRS